MSSAASAEVRTLFVGIDRYSFSHEHDAAADADFHDLQGAVADVNLVKRTLAAAYGLKLDADPPGAACPTRIAPSITLLDACATRDAILHGLEGQVAAARPGDTVLFYYAGHGSQHLDSGQVKVSGNNSTLVPADAQRPPVRGHADILDQELKARIDQALARGVNVVTVFDSCHSGSATRDLGRRLTTRSAPPIRTPPPPAQPPPSLPAVADPPAAYAVHIAAATDEEEAHETVRDGEHHGLFTLAFTGALAEKKGATYFDLVQETRRKLEQMGTTQQLKVDLENQHMQAEGPLAARFLGAAPDTARSYPAEAQAADTVLVRGGSLSGVTPGSSFEVFASSTAMQDKAAPLGRGVIAEARPESAGLRLEKPLAGAAPGAALYVRELAHNYGTLRLRVAIQGGSDAERARVARELALLSYVAVGADAPQFVIALEGGQAEFRTADGVTLSKAGPVSEPVFARRLADTTRAASNYFALLGLRNDAGAAWGHVDLLRGGCQGGPDDCGLSRQGDQPTAKVKDPVDVWVTNTSQKPLYRYVLFLSAEDYRISVLSPAENSSDPPLQPGQVLDAFEGRVTRPGRGAVLLLLTEQPISVSALRQEPVRGMGPQNDLETLLLYAGAGQRGDAVVRTGAWGATVASLAVTP